MHTHHGDGAPEDFPAADDFYRCLGARIRTARVAAELTQGALAAILQVHANTVSRWETGTYQVSLYDVLRMARLWHRPLSWFFLPAVRRPADLPQLVTELR